MLIVVLDGKNISGDGMDPNVLGRSLVGVKNPEMNVEQITVLDITPESHATGIGLADVTAQRLFDKMDFTAMFTNAHLQRAGLSRIAPFMPNQKMISALPVTLEQDLGNRIVRITSTWTWRRSAGCLRRCWTRSPPTRH